MAEHVSQMAKSLGAAVGGMNDPYADGKAAKVWEAFIGDQNTRTQNYKNFLVTMLRENGCKRILDVACGTGIDSIMLLEEGFDVVSVDASDKMLKYALRVRWNRRHEPAFNKWVIEEANWLTLTDDIENFVGEGFDAVLCLGNSFSHLLDPIHHQEAIRNFEKCLKRGGFLLIDHRNYDSVVGNRLTSSKNVYFNPKYTTDIKTSVISEDGKPVLVIRNYSVDLSSDKETKALIYEEDSKVQFRFSFYPHSLRGFDRMLEESFGENSKYKTYGDFKPLDQIESPNYYIHIVEKYSTVF